jgi:hypothetical protein
MHGRSSGHPPLQFAVAVGGGDSMDCQSIYHGLRSLTNSRTYKHGLGCAHHMRPRANNHYQACAQNPHRPVVVSGAGQLSGSDAAGARVTPGNNCGVSAAAWQTVVTTSCLCEGGAGRSDERRTNSECDGRAEMIEPYRCHCASGRAGRQFVVHTARAIPAADGLRAGHRAVCPDGAYRRTTSVRTEPVHDSDSVKRVGAGRRPSPVQCGSSHRPLRLPQRRATVATAGSN